MIARLTERLPQHARVLVGPGDDAAVVATPDGRVVATTDLLVEGRHFRTDWSSAYDVGRKAAAQNLADIVVMGAVPTALLVGLAAPPDLALAWLDGLADGLREECALVKASVVGGDLVAADRLTVAVTALGDLRGREPVTRAGARPGDVVVVAGRLGFAAAGLALLRAGRGGEPLADAHRRPQVAYAAALQLADAGATAMIDVSDGLVADIGHLAERSRVRIRLTCAALPVAPEIAAAAASLAVDPVEWVAGGGDDHAIVATLPERAVARAESALAGLPGPPPFARIGVVARADHIDGRDVEAGGVEAGVEFTDRTPAGPAGHDHFRDT